MSSENIDIGLKEIIAVYLKGLRSSPIIKEICSRLRKELSPNLVYHSVDHTEKVIDEVVLFAVHDQLKEREIELLAIAAAFHDSGFLVQNENNEKFGAQFAVDAMLQQGGYSKNEMSLVKQMILDTALVESSEGLKQISTHPLSEYLLDADLSNFGRDDFFQCLNQLKQELAIDEKSLYNQTISILKIHQWFTKAAFELRQVKKEENLKKFMR